MNENTPIQVLVQPHGGGHFIQCELHKFADGILRPKRNRFHRFVQFGKHVQSSPGNIIVMTGAAVSPGPQTALSVTSSGSAFGRVWTST